MKKAAIAGLALVIVGIVVFGAGFIGARGDLSVANGTFGPFTIQLPGGDGGLLSTSRLRGDSSENGIGGGRGKPMTTPPPVRVVDSGSEEDLTIEAAMIKSVEISELRADVEVAPSADGQIHVSAEKRAGFYCEVENSGGVLKIERKSSVKLNFSLLESRSTLRVELPEELYCELDIENSCGGVSVSGLKLSDMEIDVDLGDISVSELRCTGVKLDADCGAIYADTVTCAGDFIADADLGDITLENVNTSSSLKAGSACGAVEVSRSSAESAHLDADMGDVSAANLVCTRSAKLECSCGAIEFTALSAGESIEIENDMGSVEGTLAGRFDDYSIQSKASLGSNNLPEQLDRGNAIELKVFTDCGSIDIGFEES